MINAGVDILPFDGNQQYDSTTKEWRGISVEVNYPSDQTAVDNPPHAGDFVVETEGLVWEVILVEAMTGNKFRLDLLLRSKEPSSSVSPSMGLMKRAGIVTPKDGLIAPHWDPTKVGTTAVQIANIFNMDSGKTASSDASTIKEGVLPETVVPELPETRVKDLTDNLAAKLGVNDAIDGGVLS